MKLTAIFLALIAVAAIAADDKAAVKPPCCRDVLPSGPHTDRSLYQLESKWTSDVGREIRLGVLRGRPQVLALFFTSCEYACPITVENMKQIELALPESLRGKVDFLLVSLDTERDTVGALREFRAKRNLAPANWTLLRGGTDDVRELAALLGVNYQRDTRGQFAHSNVITVLNADGEIIHQQQGLNQPHTETIAALAKAVAAQR
jgi:protein SCO1